MFPLKKILFPVDFSANSLTAGSMRRLWRAGFKQSSSF